MLEEQSFLKAIKNHPTEDLPRLVYADWLDERNDPRANFIRLQLALLATAPDHIDFVAGEHELSALRKGCDPAWLTVIEPERVPFSERQHAGRGCQCFDMGYGSEDGDSEDLSKQWTIPNFHVEPQDTECNAWKHLLELVDEAAADGRDEFAPLRQMNLNDRSKIITLPATIAKLKAVKTLSLYGSYLTRIPPEIREMTSLVDFVPYTSYRLHWFPFEITQCPNLRKSTVSTRALYGNVKYRPPFPRLDADALTAPGRMEPTQLYGTANRTCSVCDRRYEDRRLHRVWVSLRVATDILPLLVNACSEECIGRLPTPPDGYVREPHKGGLGVQQPDPY
jgi:uncharacterized protein (TIGR02996 family)